MKGLNFSYKFLSGLSKKRQPIRFFSSQLPHRPSLVEGNIDPSRGNCGISILLKKGQTPLDYGLLKSCLSSVSRRGSTYQTQHARYGGDGIGIALLLSPHNLAKHIYKLDPNEFEKKGFSLQCFVPEESTAQNRVDDLISSITNTFSSTEFILQHDHVHDYSLLSRPAKYRLGKRIDLVFHTEIEKKDPEFRQQMNEKITLFNMHERRKLQESVDNNGLRKPLEVISATDRSLMFKSFAHSPLNDYSILDQFPEVKEFVPFLDGFMSQTRKATGSSVKRSYVQPFGSFNSIFLVNGEMNNKYKLITPIARCLGLESNPSGRQMLAQLSDTALQNIAFQYGVLNPQTLTMKLEDYKANVSTNPAIFQQGPLTYVYCDHDEFIIGRDPYGGRPAYLSYNNDFIGFGSVQMPLEDATSVYISPGSTVTITDKKEIAFNNNKQSNPPIKYILPTGKHVDTAENTLPDFVEYLKYPEIKELHRDVYKKLRPVLDPTQQVTAMGHQGEESSFKAKVAGVCNEAYDSQLHPSCTQSLLYKNINDPSKSLYSPSPFITLNQLNEVQSQPNCLEFKMTIDEKEITDEVIVKLLDRANDKLQSYLQTKVPSALILDFLPETNQQTPLSPIPLGVVNLYQQVEKYNIPIILKAIPTDLDLDSFNEVLFSIMAGATAIYNPVITKPQEFKALHDTFKSALGRTGITFAAQMVGSKAFVSSCSYLAEHMGILHQEGVNQTHGLSYYSLLTQEKIKGLPRDLGKSDTSSNQYLNQEMAIRAQEGPDGMKEVHEILDEKDPLVKQFNFIKQFKPTDVAVGVIGGGAASLTAIEQSLEKTDGPVDILVRSPQDFPGHAIYPAQDHYEIIEGLLSRFIAVLQDPRVTVIQVNESSMYSFSQNYNCIVDTRYKDSDSPNTVQKFLDFARIGTTSSVFSGELNSPYIFFTGGFGNVFDDVIKIFKQEEAVSMPFINYIKKYPELSLNALIRKSPESLFYKALNEENSEFLNRIKSSREKFPDSFRWYSKVKPSDSQVLDCLGEKNFKSELDDFTPGLTLMFNCEGDNLDNGVEINKEFYVKNSLCFPAYVQNIGGEFSPIANSDFTNVILHGWRTRTGSIKQLGEQAQDLEFPNSQSLTQKSISYDQFVESRAARDKLRLTNGITEHVLYRLENFSRYPNASLYGATKSVANSAAGDAVTQVENQPAKQGVYVEETLLDEIKTNAPLNTDKFAYIDPLGQLHWIQRESTKSVYSVLKQLGLLDQTSCDNTNLNGAPSCSECGGYVVEPAKLTRIANSLKPKAELYAKDDQLYSTLGCLTNSETTSIFIHRKYQAKKEH